MPLRPSLALLRTRQAVIDQVILAESYRRAEVFARMDCAPPIDLRHDRSVVVVVREDDLNRLRGRMFTASCRVSRVGYIRQSFADRVAEMVCFGQRRPRT